MKYLKDEEEAKDAVQQVFLKTITELGRYRVDYFKSWIYTVARNHCLMKLRDHPEKHSRSLSEDHVIEIPEEELERLSLLKAKELKLDLLGTAVDELKEEQKQCIQLFYLDKKSYQEIIDETGFSMMQVKSHIQNGKRNLKILLDKKIKENG